MPSSASADAGVALLVLEEPLQVLPRQARAGADEVLHQHLLRGGGVAELEGRVDLRDRLVPAQLLLVHQLGEEERRHRLRVRRGDEERVRVDRVRLAQLVDAEAALVDDLAAVDEAKADAGDVELLHPRRDEVLQRRDALRVERVRLLPRERLARVALRAQAAEMSENGRAALLERRLGRVDDQHRPDLPARQRQREDDVAARWATSRSRSRAAPPSRRAPPRRRELQRPLEVRLEGGPGRGDRGVGVLRLDVDDRERASPAPAGRGRRPSPSS